MSGFKTTGYDALREKVLETVSDAVDMSNRPDIIYDLFALGKFDKGFNAFWKEIKEAVD